MTLAEYFANNKGRGIISTSDREGRVNAAVYATPHFMEDGQIAFIMRDRLTHKNIGENPYAAYLFTAEGGGGVRLYLEKTKEDQDSAKIEELHRRKRSYAEEEELGPKFLVYFKVNKILPLIGAGDPGVTVQ